jgi:hypothetical protein
MELLSRKEFWLLLLSNREMLLNVALKQESGEENWNNIYEITEKIPLQHF